MIMLDASVGIILPLPLVLLLVMPVQEGVLLVYRIERRKIFDQGVILSAVVSSKRINLSAGVSWTQVNFSLDGKSRAKTIVDSYDLGTRVFVGETIEVRICLNGIAWWFPGFLSLSQT